MPNIFRRKPAADPAAERYPEALAGLLSLGKPTDDTRYQEWAEQLKDHAPDLIRMVLDEDLNQRMEDDPAVWAPLHAMQILGALGAEAATQPLTACLDWHDDWVSGALPKVYAGIGPSAIPVLQAYLEDSTHDQFGRAKASESLAAIAQAHPAVQKAIVAYLTAFLDRPSADDSATEEDVTTFVIGDLADLGDPSAYPAIKRAYDENRVDPQVIGLDDVEADFGLRPKPDYTRLPVPPEEPGVRLSLRCKACGRERSYLFPKVYCDLGTAKDEKKSAKYDSIIIPQRVVCQKCGAVDQYEISAMGHMALIADLLMRAEPKLQQFRREDQRVQYMEFTTRWGSMHPLEGLERYQTEIARHPDDADLRVGYGNVLKFLGRTDQAEAEYQRAGELDPGNPHVWFNLADLATDREDYAEAIRLWQRVLEVTPHSKLLAEERRLFLETARDSLRALRGYARPISRHTVPLSTRPALSRSPERSEGAAEGTVEDESVTSPLHPAQPSQEARPIPRVGRNQPCPCGSGKKYKHCHGRRVE
jgi:tetratricopeptide (TPR) repeat protein